MIIVITAIQARTNTFVAGSEIKFVRCPECGAQFQDGYIYHRMTSRVTQDKSPESFPVLHLVGM